MTHDDDARVADLLARLQALLAREGQQLLIEPAALEGRLLGAGQGGAIGVAYISDESAMWTCGSMKPGRIVFRTKLSSRSAPG